MHTVQLNIHDSVYDSFLTYLKKFKNNEIKIVNEKQETTLAEKRYQANREYIRKEIEDMDSGKAVFYSLEEVEKSLDSIIDKYENNS